MAFVPASPGLVALSQGGLARGGGLGVLLTTSVVSWPTGLRDQLLDKIKTDYDEPTMRRAELYLHQNPFMVESNCDLDEAYAALEGTS